MVEWLFLAVPQGCLRFVIVVFPDHTHLLYSILEKLTHTRCTLYIGNVQFIHCRLSKFRFLLCKYKA